MPQITGYLMPAPRGTYPMPYPGVAPAPVLPAYRPTYDTFQAQGVAPIAGGLPGNKADEFIRQAMRFLNQPYKWGGGHGGTMSGPGPVDCSGLIQQAARFAGLNLDGTAAAQQRKGVAVSMSQLQPGDLVFHGNPASHVGIYIGNGKVLHAPHTGSHVQIVDLKSYGYFTSARRVFDQPGSLAPDGPSNYRPPVTTVPQLPVSTQPVPFWAPPGTMQTQGYSQQLPRYQQPAYQVPVQQPVYPQQVAPTFPPAAYQQPVVPPAYPQPMMQQPAAYPQQGYAMSVPAAPPPPPPPPPPPAALPPLPPVPALPPMPVMSYQQGGYQPVAYQQPVYGYQQPAYYQAGGAMQQQLAALRSQAQSMMGFRA